MTTNKNYDRINIVIGPEGGISLKEEELQPFMKLLNEIESNDLLIKNKHFFSDFLIKEPDLQNYDKDFNKKCI
mgnify:CR=1 FL=1